MAERGEMNPNLMGPSCLWTHAHQRRRAGGVRKPLKHGHMAYGFAQAARFNRHPLALDRMTPEWTGNCDPIACHESAHDGDVNLAHGPVFELARE